MHHLDAVPRLLNDAVHRLFLGSMVLVIYLFYQYIAILVEEETEKPRRLDLVARIFLAVAELGNFLLPISYTVTPEGNYSSGPYMLVPYVAVAFYLLLCAGLLVVNWGQINRKKKLAIGSALLIEVIIVPCFIGIFSEREKTGNIIGLFIGVFLLLCCQNGLGFDMLWKLAIPAIIVIIG